MKMRELGQLLYCLAVIYAFLALLFGWPPFVGVAW